jgi:hypothetical protein
VEPPPGGGGSGALPRRGAEVLCDGRHPHYRTRPQIGATSWRLRKKMTHWAHMSASGEGMIENCVYKYSMTVGPNVYET